MSVSSMRIEKLHTELFEKMQEEQRVVLVVKRYRRCICA